MTNHIALLFAGIVTPQDMIFLKDSLLDWPKLMGKDFIWFCAAK